MNYDELVSISNELYDELVNISGANVLGANDKNVEKLSKALNYMCIQWRISLNNLSDEDVHDQRESYSNAIDQAVGIIRREA